MAVRICGYFRKAVLHDGKIIFVVRNDWEFTYATFTVWYVKDGEEYANLFRFTRGVREHDSWIRIEAPIFDTYVNEGYRPVQVGIDGNDLSTWVEKIPIVESTDVPPFSPPPGHPLAKQSSSSSNLAGATKVARPPQEPSSAAKDGWWGKEAPKKKGWW